MKSHPNVGLFIESSDPVCPYCGSSNIHKDGNYYYTMVGKYPTWVCDDCNGVARGRKTEYKKENRNNLIVSIAR